MRKEFCCDNLIFHIKENEIALRYNKKFREFGIPVLDGGTSSQMILFCPWCGKKLPESLRSEWFNELEKLGFDDPSNQKIPKKYYSDEWWKSEL